MRTVSSAHAAPQGLARQYWAKGVIGLLRRWLVAYQKWKTEQAAIARLQSMSDRELKDIGVTRSAIRGAVRDQAARHCAYIHYS
jgi:uncharacterized protein YjiS (DUF1127 family)